MLSDTQMQRLLDIALAGCRRGLVLQAREIYAAVLALKPAFPPALIGQAFSHIVVDEFDEAENLLRQDVLKTNPEDVDALLMLGLTLILTGQAHEAREALAAVYAAHGHGAPMAGELLAHLG